jgi:hypothetical protein
MMIIIIIIIPSSFVWRCLSRLIFEKCSIRISLETPAILAILTGFPHSLQANAGIVSPRVGHDLFLSKSSFNSHPTTGRYVYIHLSKAKMVKLSLCSTN